MPAEWESHEATWLGWPHELTDWPGKFSPIPWAFAEIVRHLSQVERVYLLVENRDVEARVRTVLKKSGANLAAVDFFRVPTDRGWMRDSGPICVTNGAGEVAYTHWRFNGWAKYENHKKDAQVVAAANKKLNRSVWQPMHQVPDYNERRRKADVSTHCNRFHNARYNNRDRVADGQNSFTNSLTGLHRLSGDAKSE